MKIKTTFKGFLIICLLTSSLNLYINRICSYNTLSEGFYQESNYEQGINLSVGISNQNLKWYSTLTVFLTVRGSVNELIPNSDVLLKISTSSVITFGSNITINYNLWNRNEILDNGSKQINIYITHVPTQQPYILIATFHNASQTGPNVTFPIYISSERTGIISFETFTLGYIGLIIFFTSVLILYKLKIETKPEIPKDNGISSEK